MWTTVDLRVEKLLLGTYPTPVSELPLGNDDDATRTRASRLWVKHDDLSSPVYGGNKVRKLEYVLGAARERGKKRLLTIGAVGSHHVLATAIHGRAHGFRVHAVLVPQPMTLHAARNISLGIRAGLTAEAAWEPSLYLRVLAAMDRDTHFISLGGSSVDGSLGYVDAALELEAQVSRGLLPEPAEIVVAMGSGGTVAGLLVGLERTRLRTKVVGVAVAKPVFVLAALTKHLTRRVARDCGVDADSALTRLIVDGDSVGAGYGHPTSAGAEAEAFACAHGVKVDPTYTAKALASALSRCRAGAAERVLFWNTLSSASPLALESGSTSPEDVLAEVPFHLRSLLRG